jgi:biotin carboxylase
MNTILIIGKSFSNLSKYILDQGDEYVVLRDSHTVRDNTKRLKRQIICDFSSDEAVLQAATEAHEKYHFSGVIGVYERYILQTARVAEQLKLPGCPVDAATACTDKFQMRQLFAKAPVKISPDFAFVHSENDLTAFASKHDFPLIIKPTNLAKSLLVIKAHDKTELLEAYDKIQASKDAIYKRYAPHQTPQFIVEEFMEGSIHSVDAFIDDQGAPHVLQEVVDYQTGHDIGYDDNFHYSRILPSALSPQDIEAIRETAAIGCQALGMKSTPAHVEIILTTEGPRIVEIGARNGGYRERMHSIANGIDITGNALRLALAQQPELTPTRNDACAVLELFPKSPGRFKGISHEAELQKLPSLDYYKAKYAEGDTIGKSSDGFKMTAVIILHNRDVEQFARDLAYVNAHVAVQTSS